MVYRKIIFVVSNFICYIHIQYPCYNQIYRYKTLRKYTIYFSRCSQLKKVQVVFCGIQSVKALWPLREERFGSSITLYFNKSNEKWHKKFKSTWKVEKSGTHQPTALDPPLIKEGIRYVLCVLFEWLVAYSVSVSAVNIVFVKNVHEKKKSRQRVRYYLEVGIN